MAQRAALVMEEVGRWIRELDLLRDELHRESDRIATELERRLSVGSYAEFQKQNWERFSELRDRVTTVEAERRDEMIERDRERHQTRLMLGAAFLSLLGSIGIELLRLVSR